MGHRDNLKLNSIFSISLFAILFIGAFSFALPAQTASALVFSTLDTGSVGFHNSMTVGSDGFPVIAYQDFTNAAERSLKLLHCTSVDCSTFDTPVTLEPGSAAQSVGFYTSIAIGNDGFPIISYTAQTSNEVKVVHCTNVSCTTHNTPVLLDAISSGSKYTSIVVPSSTGLPVISYQGPFGEGMNVIDCTVANCSAFNTEDIHDGVPGQAGAYSSMGVSPFDGFPAIAYRDEAGANLDLKFIKCADASCNTIKASSPVVLDSVGDVGLYTSITFASTDGKPIITYYDQGNQDLKLIRCTDHECTATGPVMTLDSTGNVGQDNQVTIGNDGFPAVVYNDNTNVNDNDVKFVHCTNATCTMFDAPIVLDGTGNVGKFPVIAITNNLPFIAYFSASL